MELLLDGLLDYFCLFDSEIVLGVVLVGVGNLLIREKIELGWMFFFEIGLVVDVMYEGGKGIYFCGSCYVFFVGFMFGVK